MNALISAFHPLILFILIFDATYEKQLKMGNVMRLFIEERNTVLRYAHILLIGVTLEECGAYCIANDNFSCLSVSYNKLLSICRIGDEKKTETVKADIWWTYKIELVNFVHAIMTHKFKLPQLIFNSDQIMSQPEGGSKHFEYVIEHDADIDGVTGSAPVELSTQAPSVADTTTASGDVSTSAVVAATSQCGVRPLFRDGDHSRRLIPELSPSTRIVGGTVVHLGSYPWQVQLSTAEGATYVHRCGGIVISPSIILTAAHCHTTFYKNYQVVVGQYNLEQFDESEATYYIENIITHNNYRSGYVFGDRNDIAIIKLRFRYGAPQHLEFDNYVQPICLPSQHRTPSVGDKCQVSGWGVVHDKDNVDVDAKSVELKGAIIPILNSSLCKQSYGDKFDEKLMICAGYIDGGTDACQGDSGGPLSCMSADGVWYVAGIVSFGLICAQKNYPGVYTRVSSYLDWIQQTSSGIDS